MKVIKTSEAALEEASKVLNSGGVVVIPTDTVYGLAAHPDIKDAVDRLYTIKARAEQKPIALLASSCESARKYIGEKGVAVAKPYWPGALTIVSQGEGVRVPDHSWTLSLIARCGGALRVTSANMSGQRPALDAMEALKDVGLSADLIVDDGVSPGGAASSVWVVDSSSIKVLRPGPIPLNDKL